MSVAKFFSERLHKTQSFLFKNKYHVEYTLLGKYLGTVLCIEFNFPTKKEPVFSLGLTIFTCVLFWIEIAKLSQSQVDSIMRYNNGHERGEYTQIDY